MSRKQFSDAMIAMIKRAYIDGYEDSGRAFYDEEIEEAWKCYAEAKGYRL